MNERTAIERVEKRYGTLEEFAVFCLTEAPEILSMSIGPVQRAKVAQMDLETLDFLVTKSPKFRVLMRSAMANGAFGLAEEFEHISSVVKIATNRGKTVVTNKGDIVTVDNTEKAVIDAGRYLNEYRGTPLEASQKATQVGVNVVFGVIPGYYPGQDAQDGSEIPLPGANGDAESRTITIAGHKVSPHTPLRPGALPPPGARARYGGVQNANGTLGAKSALGTDLDFATTESPTEENLVPRAEPLRKPAHYRPGVGLRSGPAARPSGKVWNPDGQGTDKGD